LSEEGAASAALLEFLNACEAGITIAKRLIAENKGIFREEESWDPAKIQWTLTEGSKGPYERSEDTNSPHFRLLMKELAQHECKLSDDGYFYWLFRNGSTVGRKKR